jgi:phosphatidate cytidylyltransferase
MKNEAYNRILSSFIVIPITFFFIIKGSILFIFFLSIFFIATLYEWKRMTEKKTYFIPGIIFLFLSTYSAYLMRGHNIEDLFFFLLVILVCIATDIGGYAFGKIFKGPKLSKISPNKTYSGMLGSFIFSVIFVNIFLFYWNKEIFLVEAINLENIFDLGLILSISLVSQIGDLIISYFKRLSKVKNTGKLIPGHGGLLDRVDGMIFAVPYTYLIFKILL